MEMKKGVKLYVRTDYCTGKTGDTHQDLQDHLIYVKNIAKERYLIGGGASGSVGGMIILEAENLEEAKKIFENDPLIIRGFYRCDIFEWDLFILSEDKESLD